MTTYRDLIVIPRFQSALLGLCNYARQVRIGPCSRSFVVMRPHRFLRSPARLRPVLPSKAALGRRRTTASASPSVTPLDSILIANRGEIALYVFTQVNWTRGGAHPHSRRVGRTAAEYGIRTTTLYTDPDAKSQHALSSPFAVNLGDSAAYLDGDRIIEVAKREGCKGIHPGYGFVCLG